MEDEHEREMKEKGDKHNRREDKRTYRSVSFEVLCHRTPF